MTHPMLIYKLRAKAPEELISPYKMIGLQTFRPSTTHNTTFYLFPLIFVKIY
jgi:hypothetical protein